MAGVEVSPSHLVTVNDNDVLVVQRFDRSGATRIGYASALTMLEASDGDRASYLDIALVIEERSARASAELEQLWRRIAFNILIANTDDHLRNHGFLHRHGDVWELSPAFDLNPDPTPGPHHLSTAVDEGDATASIGVLMSVTPQFRLRSAAARSVLSDVLTWAARAAASETGPATGSKGSPARHSFGRSTTSAAGLATVMAWMLTLWTISQL